MTATVTHSTLIENWGINSFVRKLLIALAGSILIAVSSKIQIPFYPVPLTMQTFVILVIGMILGWKWGGFTVTLYLLQGISGMPVFAGTPVKGIGITYMMGPTGGYLLGFLVAVIVVGYLAEKKGWDHSLILTFLAMVTGNLVIYTLGILWLGNLIGWDKPVLELGVYPFLLGDLFKILLATFLIPFLWRISPRKSLF